METVTFCRSRSIVKLYVCQWEAVSFSSIFYKRKADFFFSPFFFVFIARAHRLSLLAGTDCLLNPTPPSPLPGDRRGITATTNKQTAHSPHVTFFWCFLLANDKHALTVTSLCPGSAVQKPILLWHREQPQVGTCLGIIHHHPTPYTHCQKADRQLIKDIIDHRSICLDRKVDFQFWSQARRNQRRHIHTTHICSYSYFTTATSTILNHRGYNTPCLHCC